MRLSPHTVEDIKVSSMVSAVTSVGVIIIGFSWRLGVKLADWMF